MIYIAIFFAAFLFSIVLVFFVKQIAWRFGIVDRPGDLRKIHTKPMPLLGGVGVFTSIVIIGALYYIFAPVSWPSFSDAHVQGKHLLGLLLASSILVAGGVIDDKYTLKPLHLLVAPFVAVLVVIAFGLGVETVTNPLTGAPLALNKLELLIFWWNGLPRYFTVIADILTFLWLFGAMYTTKLLDGIDGLVSGIAVIGASIIGVVSLFFFVNEPTALISFLVAGAFAGFLLWNFNPAKIFLGEAGSMFAGFLLGALAIISGAKFAIALLVLGIPILDTAWIIFRRIAIEKKSPFTGDRKHLHFRMLDAGFTQRQTAIILWSVSALFGAAALFMQTQQKIIALLLVVCVMAFLVLLLKWRRAHPLDRKEEL